MSQASSNASAEAAEPTDKSRSWWLTLPGMFTALAGLISAVTGLIVAVHQFQPSHSASPPTQAVAAPSPALAETTPAVANASPSPSKAHLLKVAFPAGRHAETNGGMRYDFLGAATRAGNPGQLQLVLRVRVTNPGRYDGNFWSSTFRLRVGSDVASPTSFLDDVVHGGTTDTAKVDFSLSAAARRATLLVGDDPTQAVGLPLTFARRR